MFQWYRKEKPFLGLAGMGGGVVSRLVGGAAAAAGYEILYEYVNDQGGRYDNDYSSSITLPADYSTAGSAIIIYGVAGGGSARGGGGDEGWGGGGGGAGSVNPGGYVVTSGISAGVTISFTVAKGSRVASPGVIGSNSTPGGTTFVNVGGSRVLTLNGGSGTDPSGGTCNNPASGGSATGSGSGVLRSGGPGGVGANRPGSCSSTAGTGSDAGAGGGGAGGHASSQSSGSPGGSNPLAWTVSYNSGTLSGKNPFSVTKQATVGGSDVTRGNGYTDAIARNVGQARAGTGYQDGNSGGAGGAGAGVWFKITQGGIPRNLKGGQYTGGVPDSLAICGGGGGANVSYADKIRYPSGTAYEPFNFRTGDNPGPNNPAQPDGFGNGGAGCLLIIGRVGDGSGL